MTRLLVFLLLIFFSSCLSLKPAATKSKSSIVETFFVGDEGLQYFIKPMCFQSISKNKCYLDLTFRHKTKIEGRATANISIQTDSQLKSVTRIIISNSTDKIILDEIDFMFIKDVKKQFTSRFTTSIPLEDLSKLFMNEQWQVEIQLTQGNQIFHPAKRTKKIINKINQTIFINHLNN